jgi:hypothetical protein
MIGNEAVILEPVRLRLALAQQGLRIVRLFPAGGFLGDAFDIFQGTHRRFFRKAFDFDPSFKCLAAPGSSI